MEPYYDPQESHVNQIASGAMWQDLLVRFQQAERLTQSEYPGFCAEAVISGVWPGRAHGNDLLDACLEARCAGLAGIAFIPTPYKREATRDQWHEICSWAERAGSAGLGITVHAGEFSPANIRSALGAPGITRIGHAIHAAFNPALLEELAEAQVTAECCLTSNVVIGQYRHSKIIRLRPS